MALRDNDPRVIGGYLLLDRLGAGGMGTVFLARAESGRPVALKIVHEQFAADAEFRTRFRQEVRAARRVSGAFTAPVVDADPEAERPWMATTYVPGRTLRDRVESEGPLSGAELRVLAVGLVEALRELHQVRVIHRDLKPDNVLLTEDGPRVIDFGISRAPDHQTMTVTGRILGTPPYMSPEQLSAPHRVTPASDVFSLGAVLVYATTGRGPFDAGSPYMTAYNVVHEPAEVAELSGTVREIVQWCLAKEPGERPGPEDLLGAFREAPEEEWGARPGLPVADASPAPTETPRRRARRRPLLVALAVAVAMLAGGGVYLSWPDRKPPGPAGASGPSTSASAAPRKGTVPDAAALSAVAAYMPVYGGSPAAVNAYGDSPSRRPKGWRPWAGGASARGCVFAEASLVCAVPNDRAASARLVRIDAATGRTMWSVPAVVDTNSVPAIVGRTIAVSVIDGLQAFALSDGRALWSRASEGTIGSVTADDATFYGGTFDGTVLALDATTGEVRWRRPKVAGFIAYPLVRISAGQVHVLAIRKELDEARHVLSLRTADGVTAGTTSLVKPCVAWGLAIAPARFAGRPGDFLCGISMGDGYAMQTPGTTSVDVLLDRADIRSVTASDRGLYGVITVRRPDQAFAELDAQGGPAGPLWQVPLGLACHPTDPQPIVTGQRAYVICGTAGAVVDLTRHALVSRFVLPAGLYRASESSPGAIVAGGLLYVQTQQGWASVDPYATPV